MNRRTFLKYSALGAALVYTGPLPLPRSIYSGMFEADAATQTTRWTPDTCPVPGCVIEYTWDDTVPQDSRVHSLGTYVRKCALHTALSNAVAYAAVLDENPRKNLAFSDLKAVIATLDEDQYKGLWSYNASRVLVINLGALATAGQKTTIQAAADKRFGAGKVIIQ